MNRRVTVAGALAGLIATELALGRFASGTSFMGLDLLAGTLVGAAVAAACSHLPSRPHSRSRL